MFPNCLVSSILFDKRIFSFDNVSLKGYLCNNIQPYNGLA